MADESFAALEPTQDVSCRIESRGVSNSGTPFVIYRTKSGERWRIDGTCNQCGQCWEGSNLPPTLVWTGTPVGEPGAISDLRPPEERLDCPVRPELYNDCGACVLRGEYL